MILQLLRQLNNLDRSKTIACSPSFCFGLRLRFPCPLPKRISSRILSKAMFIPQNHPKSQQRVRTCAVIEKPVFRASLALPYDRGRSGYEIKYTLESLSVFENWLLRQFIGNKIKFLLVSSSAYHLNGIFGNSGENSNGTVHPGGMFSKKRKYLSRYSLFLALTGMPGNFCTICPQLQVPEKIDRFICFSTATTRFSGKCHFLSTERGNTLLPRLSEVKPSAAIA